MVPSSASGDCTSPRERFLGRKIDYQRDLRVGFGDYVQTYTPNIIKNSMTSRTEGAIALLPMGNLAGACKFFKLSTKQVVTRDQWTPLPMPDNVIAYMNKFADAQSKARQTTVSADPKFYLHDKEINDEVEAEEQPDWEEPTHLVQDLGAEEVAPPDPVAPMGRVTRSATAQARSDQGHLAAREAAFGVSLLHTETKHNWGVHHLNEMET